MSHSASEFREYDVDAEEEPRSYLPPWITQYQPKLPSPQTTFEGPGISRELALAAMRQIYLYRDGKEIDGVYKILQRKALLAGAQHRDTTPKLALEASIKHASHESKADPRKLEEKVRFLEAQLESQRPYLQLYRLGAGSLFIAVLSIVIWLITGIGIPFHPIFALGVIPVAIGVIVMAFMIRPAQKAGQ